VPETSRKQHGHRKCQKLGHIWSQAQLSAEQEDRDTMTAKKRRTSAAHTQIVVPVLTEATIAERAYHRWLSRGCPMGDGRDDWFAAQAELAAQTAPPLKKRVANTPRARAQINSKAKPQSAAELAARAVQLYESN
jgi:hypothetical protein